jgi:hypothetical protein
MSEVDTVRTSVVKDAAQFLTHLVHQHVHPLPYDRVHTDDGLRFRVTVSEYDGDETDRRLEQYAKPKEKE